MLDKCQVVLPAEHQLAGGGAFWKSAGIAAAEAGCSAR